MIDARRQQSEFIIKENGTGIILEIWFVKKIFFFGLAIVLGQNKIFDLIGKIFFEKKLNKPKLIKNLNMPNILRFFVPN